MLVYDYRFIHFISIIPRPSSVLIAMVPGRCSSDGFQFKVPQAQGPGVWDMNSESRGLRESRCQEIRRQGQVAARGLKEPRSHQDNLSIFHGISLLWWMFENSLYKSLHFDIKFFMIWCFLKLIQTLIFNWERSSPLLFISMTIQFYYSVSDIYQYQKW